MEELKDVPVLTPDRAMWEWLKYKSKYKGLKVTQGYLRLIQPLGATNSIEFPVLEDSGRGAQPMLAGEYRLKRSDAFWATQFGFFIDRAADTADNTPTLVGQTFPNVAIFLGAGQAAALETLYNSSVKIEIDSDLYFQNLDLKRFRYAGVAQQFVGAATQPQYVTSEFNPKTGFYECVPHIEFSGNATPTVVINLPVNTTMTSPTADTTNYGIWHFRGFYIPGGAKLGGR